MNENPMAVIPVLFGLSLLAAVLLFKFFKSTAVIKTKEYRAGGAIGGFIIVFLMLFFSFSKLAGYQKTIADDTKKIDDLNARLQNLRKYVKPREIKGKVAPFADQTKMLVVFQTANTDLKEGGSFQMAVPCVDPNHDPLTVYVLRPGGRFVQYGLDEGQNLTDLKFSIPQ
jgi:hypothetical protein